MAVETLWIGSTVYPECPVWRVRYDDRLVVDTSTLGLSSKAGGSLAYGMTLVSVTRHRAQTVVGPGRVVKARFAARDDRVLEVTLRVTDLSAFCAVRQWRKRSLDGDDLSITRFPKGSVPYTTTSDAHKPQVRFSPDGKTIAFWRHAREQHILFFDRPGDLAVRRFGALETVEELAVADGRMGCEILFTTMPFTKAVLPAPVFGEALTPAYRAAFEMMLGRSAASDDFWMIRGEPGQFALVARRQGNAWQVAGVTAAARTLTVRFEDLWLRMPAELRLKKYTVAILRDPLKDEPGDRVEESFAGQTPDVRIALDLAKNGGFMITFWPQD